jgi:hypothetical protein
MRIRLPRQASNLFKKATAAVVLLGVLLGIAGTPMVRIARKDRSRPYPCQDRPCGCASADECWHHCCCMNNKEKLVWARDHGVAPPEFVVAAAAREDHEPTPVCDRGEGCQSAASQHDERPCCRSRHSHRDVAASDDPRNAGKPESQVKLVLTDFARQCSGLPPIVLLFADALPSAACVQWKPLEALVEYMIDAPRSCASADLSPPVPPPKLSRGLAA